MTFSMSSNNYRHQDLILTEQTKLKVAVIGSGNWGTAISRIIGKNVNEFSCFYEVVNMYVYEEMVSGQKLSDIINLQHENIKYLPGYKLPSNVIAVTDLVEAARDADILVFVVPHQFVPRICNQLKGFLKPSCFGISLIKGIDSQQGKGLQLISDIISELLDMDVSVLMGANLAKEIAAEFFCETTIGCRFPNKGNVLKNLVETPYFRVVVCKDVEAVELCGALKNIVAVGAGFIDGLHLGDNTKAAIIRLGLMEMMEFCKMFYPETKLETFLESCGVADLITTCYGGRNRRVAEAFVLSGKTINELEQELLNGQKLQGPSAAEQVYEALLHKGVLEKFPLMATVHKICIKELTPSQLIDNIRNHPVHKTKSY